MTAIALITLVLALCLTPYPSHAQAVAKTPRIGMLTNAFAPHSGFEGFRHGLRDLGYVEGQSIALEYRYAEGNPERLTALAAELVRLKVDVILADGGAAARVAQHATETLPI
jgi:putative ABC transport system substrate-binding protein